jgi:hypothetical protein
MDTFAHVLRSSKSEAGLKSRQIRRPFRYFYSVKIPEESRCSRIGIASLTDKNGESSSCPLSDSASLFGMLRMESEEDDFPS